MPSAVQKFNGLRPFKGSKVQGPAAVQGFKRSMPSAVQRFNGLRPFKGSMAQRFPAEKAACTAFSAVGTQLRFEQIACLPTANCSR